MTKSNELIQRLLDHCRKKPGAKEAPNFDEDEPQFNILEGFLDGFARFYLNETPNVLMLRCSDSQRHKLETQTKSVTESQRMHWDTNGWAWTDVVLDGALSEQALLFLLDESYQLVYDSDAIDEDKKHEIELIERNLEPLTVVDDLISYYGLSQRKQDIEQVARPAVILNTFACEEANIDLGQTKIGGRPDLPEHSQWPTHSSGKSLAFLAQVNLSEVHKHAPHPDLPDSGILYFFTVFGWQDEDDADPQLPDEQPNATWTQILYEPNSSMTLQRQSCPTDVNEFPAAGVNFLPTISLPSGAEPAVSALDWSEDEVETYDWNLVLSFKSVRNYGLGHPSNHLLMGFADYEQEFEETVATENLQLLFQLATDDNTEMCWGDGGYIYFWIKPEHLRVRNFSHIFVDYQCG